jgi:hypothetical protein
MNSKIRKWEWWLLYIVGVVIWIAQMLLNFFIGPGELINEIITPGLVLLLSIYFHIRGVSMNDPSTLFRVIGNLFGSEGTVEIYPGILITIFFTHRVVKAEQNPKKLTSKVVLLAAGANKLAGKVDGLTGGGNVPSNIGGVRQPPIIQKPLNQGGVRLPNGGI